MVTAAFRAMDEALSKDGFAHLWSSDSVLGYARRYSTEVSAYEPHAHCLRNRYFYDQLNQFVTEEKIEMLINFGCGFSMYPFILPASLRHIEIDLPEVIAYKQKHIVSWQQNGTLPPRDIQYLSTDFNKENDPKFLSCLKKLIGDSSTFILLEGVLFFINREDTLRLFSMFSKLQQEGDLIGSVSFRPELEKRGIFGKLASFVEGNLNKNQQFTYQTVADEFYKKLPDYQLKDHQDTMGLNLKYSPEKAMHEEDVLIEHMYILEKSNI